MNLEKLNSLGNFTGTEQYYSLLLFPHTVYTDGIRYLAQNADCYWLIDQIASAQQTNRVKNDPRLQEMQFWTLKKAQGNSATLVCERDTNDVAFTVNIPFTDFPFEALGKNEFKIWVAPNSLDGETTVMTIYLYQPNINP